MIMAKSIEELESKIKKIKEKMDKLKADQRNSAIRVAKNEKKKFREYTAHMMVKIGGYVLTKSKEKKNLNLLKEIMGTLENEKEKYWLNTYMNGIPRDAEASAEEENLGGLMKNINCVGDKESGKRLIVADVSCLSILNRYGMINVLGGLFTEVYTTPEIKKGCNFELPEYIKVEESDINLKNLAKRRRRLSEAESSAIGLGLKRRILYGKDEYVFLDHGRLAKYLSRYGIDWDVIGVLDIINLAVDKGVVKSKDTQEIIAYFKKKHVFRSLKWLIKNTKD
jgi:predicted nucleic acid-binding protein